MKKYNNKFIPDVGKCFYNENKLYNWTYSDNDEYEEVEIDLDNITETITNHFNIDNKFEIILSDTTKKTLVNKLFSNDDEIAIILNYQDNKTEEHTDIYNILQGWRRWISELINKCKILQNE